MKNTIAQVLIVLLVTLVLGACVSTPKIVEPQKRFFWPPEPDEPRVEWIAAYSSDLDIKEKSIMSTIIGDDISVQFGRPISVAGDGEGRFVVCDQELSQVFLFNLNNHEALPLGGAALAGSLKQPSAVTVDGDGNFYVADNVSRRVYVLDGNNSVLRIMDLGEYVKSIGGMVVDRARARLIIPDAKGSMIAIFTLTGKLLSKIDGKGYFSYPNAVAVASDGSLLIADSYYATILHFSAEGKYLKSIGKRGDSPGNLSLVTGVAVDSEDHIYATDGRLHNLTIFDKEGNPLLVIGGLHSVRTANIGRGGFMIPQGVSIDKNDRIYVADSFNKRVQLLQYMNQRYLTEHPVVRPKQ